MQKYIVEIFNKHFVKVAHYGPVPYKRAHEEAARLKLDGFQVLITEEDMVTDDAEWVLNSMLLYCVVSFLIIIHVVRN